MDAALVAPYFNGDSGGTALMTADNVAEKVKELQIDNVKICTGLLRSGGNCS